MSRNKTALIYIGQTPRPDITPEMRSYLEGVCDVVETGALDPFTDAEIDSMKPNENGPVLITKRKDGQSVTVDEGIIHKLLAATVDRMAQQGCTACAIMCTGNFPNLPKQLPVITSDEAFHHRLDTGAATRCIGILVPMESQQKAFAALYAATGKKTVTDFASPYGSIEAIAAAAHRLKEKGADCICLDCMGYSGSIAETVTKETGLPCYIPRKEIAKQIICLYQKSI